MIVYAQGDQWLAFTDAGARRMERFARLDRPATVVWQPNRSTAGVASFEGDTRHAGVLIERRLRTEGAIEADTKVFIHHLERVGASYQVLYSTASLEEWQRMQHWCGVQAHHCAWTLATALAWSKVRENAPIVLHSENSFQFFGRSEGRILHVNTLAFGTDEASLVHAARTLGARVRDEWRPTSPDSPTPSASNPVRWASTFGALEESVHAGVLAAFGEASGLPVESADTPVLVEETRALSALPAMAVQVPVRLLLNTARDRVLLVAERYRLATAGVAVVLSVLFMAAAGHKVLQANRLTETTRALTAKAAEARRVMPTAVAPEDEQKYKDQMSFVENLDRLQAGLDVADILRSLKTASGADLRILAVRSEERSSAPDATTPGVVVDGVLQDNATTPDSLALSSFVRSLALSGYAAEPLDTRAAAAASSVSSRLFTYRLTRRAAPPTGSTKP